ncbi:unnamed protein product [Albugo candida]|uniref:Uncharacterized protein n=1 Tax=Albugo candida TaxID=65357 RepID=A0A024GNM7_9STRA|nr:unnamed protein product [Albugo candida]|eukprot:CCI48146.1 unnamed protein product [Albugo candida]
MSTVENDDDITEHKQKKRKYLAQENTRTTRSTKKRDRTQKIAATDTETIVSLPSPIRYNRASVKSQKSKVSLDDAIEPDDASNNFLCERQSQCNLDVSLLSQLRAALASRGVPESALDRWRMTENGHKLIAPDTKQYSKVLDAVRVIYYESHQRIAREDLFFVATIRRELLEPKLPFTDGPVTVLSLGYIIINASFHKTNELFPVGYMSSCWLEVVKETQSFHLELICGKEKRWNRCATFSSISCKRSRYTQPYSIDQIESFLLNVEVKFQSNVLLIAWKEAVDHFQGLQTTKIQLLQDSQDMRQANPIVLASESTEDGFGLSRRQIAQAVEGLDSALACSSYQFWEERHPVKLSIFQRNRIRLVKQLTTQLKGRKQSRAFIQAKTSQESVLARQIHPFKSQDKVLCIDDQRASKMHIPIDQQNRSKDKTASLRAKKEVVRMKSIRRTEIRRAKEEEKLMREEEKEMRKFLREEEKQARKQFAKEEAIKKRVAARNVYENISDAFKPKLNVRQRAQEREREMKACRYLEKRIWDFVRLEFLAQTRYEMNASSMAPIVSDNKHTRMYRLMADANIFPERFLIRDEALERFPDTLQVDVLFIWDTLSTFSDQLGIVRMPSLHLFASVLFLQDGSSPVGDSMIEEMSLAYQYFGFHALLLEYLMAEYYPNLQTGISPMDFNRSRPLNLMTWPEIARTICVLAMDKHFTLEDASLKALRGIKSFRDENFASVMRQDLERRGQQLLWGQSTASNSKELSHENLYGCKSVVMVQPLKNVVQLSKDSNGAVKVISSAVEAIQTEFILAVNGHDARNASMENVYEWSEESEPYGLLLSKEWPPFDDQETITFNDSSTTRACIHLLHLLRSKEVASPFNQPVDASLYPDYYTSGVVTEPMDLSTILEKLEDGEYTIDDSKQEFDMDAFVDDVHLVKKNCLLYNSVHAEISHMATKLSSIFDRLVRELIETQKIVAEDQCRACGMRLCSEKLLRCYRCDAPFHSFCIRPAVKEVPTDWYCGSCENQKMTPIVRTEEKDVPEDAKRLSEAIEWLSKENYSLLSLKERISILRILCDLVIWSDSVRKMYQSIEEAIETTRKERLDAVTKASMGSFLVEEYDMAWKSFFPDTFGPPASCLKPFSVEIPSHLKFESNDLPAKCSIFDEEMLSDEQTLIEMYGDLYLETMQPTARKCVYCDGIEEPLEQYQRSVLTLGRTSNSFELPSILRCIPQSSWGSMVRVLLVNDVTAFTAMIRVDKLGLYVEMEGQKYWLYSLNELLLPSTLLPHQLFTLAHCVSHEKCIWIVASTLPTCVMDACFTIVRVPNDVKDLGIEFDTAQAITFVKNVAEGDDFHTNFASFSGHIFPNDILWSVNDTILCTKSEACVRKMVSGSSFHGQWLLLMRSASNQQRRRMQNWRQQTLGYLSGLCLSSSDRVVYSVSFGKGPLGLVLAMDSAGIHVQSMNNAPGGGLGQASASGQISMGDRIEGINGTACGIVQSLSHFTSYLLSLPRPITLQFSSKRRESKEVDTRAPHVCHEAFVRAVLDHHWPPNVTTFKTIHLESNRPFSAVAISDRLVLSQVHKAACIETDVDDPNVVESVLQVGDCVVGSNGALESIKNLQTQIQSRNPLTLHFVQISSFCSSAFAHTNCLNAANNAFDYLETLVKRMDDQTKLTAFERDALVPRTLYLGACRHQYRYYRFYASPKTLFVLSPTEKWLFCDQENAFIRVIAYLQHEPEDRSIAMRLQALYWHPHSTEYQHEIVPSESGMRAYLQQYGQRFCVGVFSDEQSASTALEKAIERARKSGHPLERIASLPKTQHSVAPQTIVMGLTGVSIPALPLLKAENAVKRALQRRYEVYSPVNALSVAVYSTLSKGFDRKRSISAPPSIDQPLAGCSRALCNAWSSFLKNPCGRMANTVTFVGVSCFEEVKKLLSITMERQVRSNSNFVCLHHTFVVALLCAMGTQALCQATNTSIRPTECETKLIAALIEALTVAILCCEEIQAPNLLRARSLMALWIVFRQAQAISNDSVSQSIESFANFLVHFASTTEYLSTGHFDDLSGCRPLRIDRLAVGSENQFTLSFLRQIRLAESARSVWSCPATKEQNLHWMHYAVDFAQGQLGIVVVNYSNRMHTILVNEFTNINGEIGQAEACGKIRLEDQIVAVNGQILGVNAMETFKAAVAQASRPLRVIFRRISTSENANELLSFLDPLPDAPTRSNATESSAEKVAEEHSSRRSIRVSRKPLTTINVLEGASERKSLEVHSDTTDGFVGQFATELLEPFHANWTPRATCNSVRLLTAQLLTMEAAIPREAFRSGRWTRLLRAAWAEMVLTCENAKTLMQAVLYLECAIEAEWLDASWKAAPLQATKHALASATIASAAMRLYALDEAIAYVRQRRSGKRKPRNVPATSTVISAPKEPISSGSPSFLKNVNGRVVILLEKLMEMHLQVAESQAIRSFNRLVSEVAGITELEAFQIDQWIVWYQSNRKPIVMSDTDASLPTAKNARLTRRRKNVNRQSITFHSFDIGQRDIPSAHNDNTLFDRMKIVIQTIMKHEVAIPFVSPVDLNAVEGYREIIEHPMDLGTVWSNLLDGKYHCVETLLSDVELIWRNCFTFNCLDSEISKSALRLGSMFKRLYVDWVVDVAPGTPVSEIGEEACRVCREPNAMEMLQCDSCDGLYHLQCLCPIVEAVPDGDWYCDACPVRPIEA